MGFACVRGGSRECDGCGACTALPAYVEDALDSAQDVSEKATKKASDLGSKIEDMISQIEDMQGELQGALDSIPAGYEDTDEYSRLEHNIDTLDAVIDAAQDFLTSIGEFD